MESTISKTSHARHRLMSNTESQICQSNAKIPIQVDLSTPRDSTRKYTNRLPTSESSISNKWGNTVLNLIKNQQKSNSKRLTTDTINMEETYYEMPKRKSGPSHITGATNKSLNVRTYKNYMREGKTASVNKHNEDARTFKPQSMSSKKEYNISVLKRDPSASFQGSHIVDNKENSTQETIKKSTSSINHLSKNHGLKTKTMYDLSAKCQKGQKNILETITKVNKRVPSYYHNSEQGKLRRYTPMEQSNSDAMKSRVMRGAYSSGKKISVDTDAGYDLVPEYSQGDKEASGGPAHEHIATVEKFEIESNVDPDEFKGVQHDADSEELKLSKVPEDTSICDLSHTDFSEPSVESIFNSARKIRKETESDSTIESKAATKGKVGQKTDWVKESNSSRIFKGIKRFFQSSSYSCGCKDDLDFKCCQTASRWLLLSENNDKNLINKNYFEDEYNALLTEVHYKPTEEVKRQSAVSRDSGNSENELRRELELRRQTIEDNKIQIIKDLNRTFVNSA